MSSKLAGGTTAARSGLGPSGPTSKGLHGGLSKRTGGSKSCRTLHKRLPNLGDTRHLGLGTLPFALELIYS